MMKRLLALGLLLLAVSGAAAPARSQAPAPGGDAIAAIRARGTLNCGVTPQVPGFSLQENGAWRGFNVDYCRAIASALLQDTSRVTYVEVKTPEDAFEALVERRIDVAVADTTVTLSRARDSGVVFPVVIYYDGQGFLLPRALMISSAQQLANTRICVMPDTTAVAELEDFFAQSRMRFEKVETPDLPAVAEALRTRQCTAYTGDVSDMPGVQSLLGRAADDFVILPEIISKSPLGIAVRAGEFEFDTVVSWIHFALVAAEEMNISSATLESMRASPTIAIQMFLGQGFDPGRPLGLDRDWTARLIQQVGNYAEIFAQHLTPLGINRGLNSLWNVGGMHYAPPFR